MLSQGAKTSWSGCKGLCKCKVMLAKVLKRVGLCKVMLGQGAKKPQSGFEGLLEACSAKALKMLSQGSKRSWSCCKGLCKVMLGQGG